MRFIAVILAGVVMLGSASMAQVDVTSMLAIDAMESAIEEFAELAIGAQLPLPPVSEMIAQTLVRVDTTTGEITAITPLRGCSGSLVSMNKAEFVEFSPACSPSEGLVSMNKGDFIDYNPLVAIVAVFPDPETSDWVLTGRLLPKALYIVTSIGLVDEAGLLEGPSRSRADVAVMMWTPVGELISGGSVVEISGGPISFSLAILGNEPSSLILPYARAFTPTEWLAQGFTAAQVALQLPVELPTPIFEIDRNGQWQLSGAYSPLDSEPIGVSQIAVEWSDVLDDVGSGRHPPRLPLSAAAFLVDSTPGTAFWGLVCTDAGGSLVQVIGAPIIGALR